jgi:hypothetical protein
MLTHCLNTRLNHCGCDIDFFLASERVNLSRMSGGGGFVVSFNGELLRYVKCIIPLVRNASRH